uniref:UTP18 small subunit processome component n=2 Tax=Cyprinus carpio TaxID=7962 RepID=A0A8C1FT64_CYPCA
MDSSESSARKQRKTPKRPLSEDASAAEERVKQKKHAALCATLGGEDASVRLLEELVFGAEEQLSERLAQDSSVLLEDDSGSESPARPVVRSAVWEDEDDELDEEVDMTHRFRRDFKKSAAENKMTKQRLQQRLKEQFQKAMGGTPNWAEVTAKRSQKKEAGTEDEDEGEELMRRTGDFIGSSDSLPKGIIKMKKCLNANSESPCGDQLSSVQFHPSAQIVMTAGLDHSLSLFQVDGKSNPKIQTIHLENYPVNKALFSADGEHIVATGLRNKLFYIYDMMEGKVIPVCGVRGLNEQRVSDFQVSPDGKYLLLSGSSGYLHLMTTKTREVIRSMKMNGSVCSAAFTSDSSKIFANSQEGEVFIWDVQSSKCLKKFADDGCVRGTSLALSRDGLYLACGSIYRVSQCSPISHDSKRRRYFEPVVWISPHGVDSTLWPIIKAMLCSSGFCIILTSRDEAPHGRRLMGSSDFCSINFCHITLRTIVLLYKCAFVSLVILIQSVFSPVRTGSVSPGDLQSLVIIVEVVCDLHPV